jgi:phage tail-like protein
MPEHGLNLMFRVTLDDHQSLGNWTKCEGLAVEYEVQEYMEGGENGFVHRLPGRCKFPNVKLTRPIDKGSAEVAKWVAGLRNDPKRQNAAIQVLDNHGDEVTKWKLTEVYPVKWTGPSLDVAGNQVAVEVLELAHHGFLGGN